MHFIKNNKGDCICERRRIKIPTVGWVRLKEKGYIPTTKDGHIVRSGTVSYKAGRYYVTCLVDIEEPEKEKLNNFGLGIDLGLSNFAIISNGKVYKNINKTSTIKKLEKKIKKSSVSCLENMRIIKRKEELLTKT